MGNTIPSAPPGTAWFIVALVAAIAFYLWQERDKDLFRVWRDQVQQIPPLAIILFALAMILIASLTYRSN